MIKLGKRLASLVDCIEGESVADIGTDHGKVVVHALLTGKVKQAIAADISEKSLQKAKSLADSYGVDADFAVSDGLERLPYIPDSIIIAGLGGREIVSIISAKTPPDGIPALLLTGNGAGRSKPVTFILMPHQDSWYLRKYLFENAVKIKKDTVIKDSGKYYDLIVTEAGEVCPEKSYTEDEIFTGKNIPFSKFYYERLSERDIILSSILASAKEKAADIIKDEASAVKNALEKSSREIISD